MNILCIKQRAKSAVRHKLSLTLLAFSVGALAGQQAFAADLLFSDNFESGTLTSSGPHFSWTPGANVSISSDKTKSGSYSVKFFYKGNTDLTADAYSELPFRLDQVYKEIWVRYWLYIPSNYYQRIPTGASNNKGLLYAWSGSYNNNPPTLVGVNFTPTDNGSSRVDINWRTDGNTSQHYGSYNWSQNMYINSLDMDSTGHPIVIDSQKDPGHWDDFVIQMKVADPGIADGVISIWKNGQLIARWNNATDYYSADPSMNGFESGYVLGWANSGFNEDTVFYMDDFKIGTTAASVDFSTQPPPSAPLGVQAK